MFHQRGKLYLESHWKKNLCHKKKDKVLGNDLNIYALKLKMANTLSVMTNVLRNAVSKQRIRYKEKGFNLDLAYISDNIIAMGYPADNLEKFYRNRLEDVYKFLEKYHQEHYKIYNLCLERSYDINKFHGRVAVYPFEDHNPPTIELIQRFCSDIDSWLKQDSLNVAAVHCKAGKGRTGTMICCYLLYSGQQSTAEDALACYDEKRTKDRKGVTIPSQRRYVQYFSKLVRSGLQYEKRTLQFYEIRFTEATLLSQGIVHCSISALQDTQCAVKVQPLQSLTVDFRKSSIIDIKNPSLSVAGDIKVELTHKTSRRKILHFWFNTFFVCDTAVTEGEGEDIKLVYTLNKSEIDDAHKDKEHKCFSEDFKVQLVFCVDSSGAKNATGERSKHRNNQSPNMSQSDKYHGMNNSSGSDMNNICNRKSSSSASINSCCNGLYMGQRNNDDTTHSFPPVSQNIGTYDESDSQLELNASMASPLLAYSVYNDVRFCSNTPQQANSNLFAQSGNVSTALSTSEHQIQLHMQQPNQNQKQSQKTNKNQNQNRKHPNTRYAYPSANVPKLSRDSGKHNRIGCSPVADADPDIDVDGDGDRVGVAEAEATFDCISNSKSSSRSSLSVNADREEDWESVYGLLRGLDCPKFSLDPESYEDESHTISNEDGSIFLGATKKTYRNNEYCIEKMRNASHPDQKLYTFLCFDTKVVENDKIRFKMYPIGLLISCSFYAITLLVYLSISRLRNLPGKILICLVSSLLAAYLAIALGQLMPTPNDDVCFVSGFLVYFCLMAAFAWMNVMCFDIWKTFGTAKTRRGFSSDETKRFVLYSVYGWGLPSLLTAITISVSKTEWLSEQYRPHFGHGRCWFTYDTLGYANLLFFSGPVGILFLVNFVLFSVTLRYCNKVKREIFRMQSSNMEKPALRRRFFMDKARFAMNTKLFVVMGITWLLEILSILLYDHKKTFFWAISDSFNVLLGVFVFFIFVFKKRVWHSVLQTLGLRFKDSNKNAPTATCVTQSTYARSISMTRLNAIEGNLSLLSTKKAVRVTPDF